MIFERKWRGKEGARTILTKTAIFIVSIIATAWITTLINDHLAKANPLISGPW
jgi:hypothetical protein